MANTAAPTRMRAGSIVPAMGARGASTTIRSARHLSYGVRAARRSSSRSDAAASAPEASGDEYGAGKPDLPGAPPPRLHRQQNREAEDEQQRAQRQYELEQQRVQRRPSTSNSGRSTVVGARTRAPSRLPRFVSDRQAWGRVNACHEIALAGLGTMKKYGAFRRHSVRRARAGWGRS